MYTMPYKAQKVYEQLARELLVDFLCKCCQHPTSTVPVLRRYAAPAARIAGQSDRS